ncbi:putative cytochrome P450 [Helianthus annuus]|uniref:Cytochrome P450 n=1 Tax=Helianthus annuus TaxID=4232 RepID=A0A251TMU2_HELAN|nr:parthenolide synthase [Helianthus annuus]KAF5799327.1 putative cytochrome P450 [Helianthus annuus]KAJ0550778.1 putative cytochrome P450 [Helianthus annuus]KAJ0557614.1 putative cytochrome P450 [Helianthus annuus]KAJ0563746.1 putative cytochrome P450 [Helianthus annuus]KAJ0729077.1 putative cytochrome P450 [Helianthus annuus]
MEIFTIFPSWLLTTTLVFFMFCMFLYTLRSNKSSITTPKLPPNPPKLPIIGNLHKLIGKSRHEALWQLSKEYGPVMLFYIGSKPYLIISSPAMAKQVLKTQDHIFCSRPLSKGAKRLTYNYLDIGFSPQSDHRREMRKILVSEFLGPKRARLFNHVLVSEIETMVRLIGSHPPNVAVNLNKLFLATVKGVVCKVAFGNNYRQQPIKGPSWEVLVYEALEMLGGWLGDSFPWAGRFIDYVSGWNDKLETCFTNLDAYIESIIDDHKSQIAEVTDEEKDFVHALLELSSEDNTSGHRLTKEDVKALIMDVLTAGVDTTLVTLVWVMSEIARSVRVKQKLQTEIRNHTGRTPKVDVLDIAKMTYLKMVVKETLRLHAPAPLLIPHECMSHCQIGGYDVLPGTSALINAWGIGRDPSTWGENAAEFYPERFEKFEVDFEMVPFGGGRRSCPAKNMAPATVEFVIANLLYWFDWEVPDGVKSEDLNMQEEGILVLRKKVPLRLVPTKYNWDD